jgi:hypothetical protein
MRFMRRGHILISRPRSTGRETDQSQPHVEADSYQGLPGP